MEEGKTKHTPGPWSVEKHAPFGWTIRAPRERHLGAGTLLCQLSGYEAGADAYLIAAAPELLEALKSAAAWLEKDGPLNGPLGQRIRAAIAKAEGK